MNKFRSIESIIRDVVEASTLSSPGGRMTGHVKGGRSGYSSSATRGQAGGHSTAMKRVTSQENEAEKEQHASKKKMESDIKKRTDAAKERHDALQSKVSEAADPDKNTEERKKIRVVSRPDDPKATSPDSKLARTAEYKTKIIDEEKPLMFSDKSFGLPKSLIDSVKSITEKKDPKAVKDDEKDPKDIGKDKTEVDLEPETKDKLDNDGDSDDSKKKSKKDDDKKDMKEAVDQLGEADVSTSKKVTGTAMHLGKDAKYDTNPKAFDAKTFDPKNKKTMPRNVYVKTKPSGKLPEEAEQPVDESLSPKQKKIAAMAGDKGKIDAADFKALRSGKCHKCGKKPCECMKEETDLSVEELEKLQAIAQQFDEARMPERGKEGQSQAGFNDKNDVTDYTITDEKKKKR